MSEARSHDKVALTVVRFLGAAALGFGSGVIFLVWETIRSSAQVDPSTVALVSGVSTLAGAAMGALGSILASTGKGAAPTPVVVEQPANNPIPTTEATATANPVVELHPDTPAESDL